MQWKVENLYDLFFFFQIAAKICFKFQNFQTNRLGKCQKLSFNVLFVDSKANYVSHLMQSTVNFDLNFENKRRIILSV
jgi:hypothetical protein